MSLADDVKAFEAEHEVTWQEALKPVPDLLREFGEMGTAAITDLLNSLARAGKIPQADLPKLLESVKEAEAEGDSECMGYAYELVHEIFDHEPPTGMSLGEADVWSKDYYGTGLLESLRSAYS